MRSDKTHCAVSRAWRSSVRVVSAASEESLTEPEWTDAASEWALTQERLTEVQSCFRIVTDVLKKMAASRVACCSYYCRKVRSRCVQLLERVVVMRRRNLWNRCALIILCASNIIEDLALWIDVWHVDRVRIRRSPILFAIFYGDPNGVEVLKTLLIACNGFTSSIVLIVDIINMSLWIQDVGAHQWSRKSPCMPTTWSKWLSIGKTWSTGKLCWSMNWCGECFQ